MGNVITANGLKPDPSKIDAIIHMSPPENRQSLQRFLGMVKYLTPFLPNESSITAPLRTLLKKDVLWSWEHEKESAFQQIKNALTQPIILQFFNVNKPVTIQTDASQSGIGSCLMQENRPVAYASRALADTEKNYSQIEKEMLAICFACAKFHQYTYGQQVEVLTDHRPLETIFKKPIAIATPRLQRMLLQLQRYSLEVMFVPGKYMYVADTLSRAYLSDNSICGTPDDIEIMVHSLVSTLPMTPAKLTEFKSAVAEDMTIQCIKRHIKYGWPKSCKSLSSDLQPYWNIRDSLHEADDLVFYGEKLVVPTKLQQSMLSLLHESHMGAEKSKACARQILFWPGMSSDIERTVNECPVCHTFKPNNQKETLMPHEVPHRPWQKVAADIMTLEKDNLVVVDYYSKYPEIVLLNGKTASKIITQMKYIFARHGIPEELICDNMPFNSTEFSDFASKWGIKLAHKDINTKNLNEQSSLCKSQEGRENSLLN